MAIYGTALLSICLLCGMIAGHWLGALIGVDANIGGVGIAMLLLIVATARLQAKGLMTKPTQDGVLFWSSIYIPIVVAMAASQNVRAALGGGTLAIVAGSVVVVVSLALVPALSRLKHSETISVSLTQEPAKGEDA